MTITQESFSWEPMGKISSKIPLSGGGGNVDVNVPENRDGTQKAGALGMSVRCCAGTMRYHGLPQD